LKRRVPARPEQAIASQPLSSATMSCGKRNEDGDTPLPVWCL
jgi:hypothetical protein